MLRRSQPPWGMCLILSIGVTMAARAQSTGYELSERDFLSEIPHVYSASRLPQQLEDAAGALTVLDREFIHLTGARELTEVDRAIAANDLPAAKQALRRINDTKKHYHDLLG